MELVFHGIALNGLDGMTLKSWFREGGNCIEWYSIMVLHGALLNDVDAMV